MSFPSFVFENKCVPFSYSAKLYGSEGVIDELQAALGITTFAVGDQLTGLPASLTDDDAIVVVPDYYPVPPNSSWVTLARDLYGNEAVAEELEVAMGSPSTIPAQLTNLPATLVDVPVVEPVEPYYLLEVNQTWEEVAAALYDSAGVLDELHTALGLNNPPPLQIGDTLTNLPATLTDDDIINTVPPFYTLSSISSWEELARTLYGTSDEAVSPNTPPPNRPAGAMQYQYTDAARPHRLTSVTGPIGRNYSYDANGNTVSDGSKTFTYNAWNKVATLTQGGNSTRFEYGPDRKRYLRVDQQGSSPNQVTTETLYVGDGYERVTTIDGGTTVEHKYHVYGIALITQAEGGNTETTHSLISDYQDSLLAIADQSGNLIQRFRYTPFGEQVDVSQGITGSHSFTTKGYTSHEHIEGMDIIHMNGRIYDPVIGRMVQSDPIVQAPTMVLSYNRYSYVWNNPMNRIDPTGYQSVGGEESEEDSKSKDTATANATDAAVSGQDPYATATVRRDANGVVYGEDIPTQELTIAKDPEPPGDRGVGLDNQTVNGDFSDVPNLDDFCGGCNNAPDTFADDLEDFGEGLLHTIQGLPVGKVAAGVGIGAIGLVSKSKELANFFPAANGFLGKTKNITLQSGQIIDRFGGTAASRFFSPVGTPAAMRALPPGSAQQPLRTFEVIKPFTVEAGRVAPAFNQIGLGTQLRSSKQLGELLERNFLREIIK